MMAELSPVLARTLAATLLAVLLALLWALMVLPIATAFEERQMAIEVGLERIARYGGVAERADTLRAWSKGGGVSAPERLLYLADTPALATASLQRDLDKIAKQHGILLRNAQGTPERSEGGLTRISVRANFSTSHRSLMPFLAGLGAQGRLIRVTELNIAAPIRQSVTRETELRVDLEVTAFMRPGDRS